MQPKEFRLLRDLIRERAGLVISQDAIRPLERRLQNRLEALELESFSDYHRFLRFHPAAEDEMQNLYDVATNNETYFFREDYQLLSFRQQILPVLAVTGATKKHLTFWSMGCSTGEEAYSIAVVLLESALFEGWNLRVYGSDISRRCLAAARKGVYGDSSFRSTSPERRSRFFVDSEEGILVANHVRQLCQFGQMNLLELRDRSTIDQVDVIFCRNVLIYFDPCTRHSVIGGIYDRLRPGGYLFLGHSESLLNAKTDFEVVHIDRDVVYRKPSLDLRTGLHPRRFG